MNYKLVKNVEWKEVEVNEKIQCIPKDWDVINFENLGKLFTGKRQKYIPTEFEKQNKDVYFSVGGEHIGENKFKLKNEVYVKASFFNKQKKGQIDINDLLIIKDGATTGKNMFVFEKPYNNMLLNEHVYRFVSNNNNDSYYVYKLFNSELVQDSLKTKINGIIPSLNQENFSQIETIYTSNLNEQKLISNILLKENNIISNIERLIEKNEILFNELSSRLLLGELRLKIEDKKLSFYKNSEDEWKEVEVNEKIQCIPKDWDVINFENLGKLFTGKRQKYIPTEFEKQNKDVYFSVGGEHIGQNEFKLKNEVYVKASFFNKQKKGQIDINDLLIIKDGATTGKNMFVFEKPYNNMLLNEHVYRFVSNNNDSYYVYKLFNSEIVQDSLKTKINGIIPSLNQENFSQIETIYTSNLEEQRLISEFLLSKEQLIDKLKSLLEKEKEKFEWLLDNLLSGKYLVKDI